MTSQLTKLAQSRLPTRYGDFDIHVFEHASDGKEHVALTLGNWTREDVVLCRLHSECLTGDVLSSLRCDCGEQLHRALELIAAEGVGILLYLRQEGRGIGLGNKIRAYALQDAGADTVEANERLGFEADTRNYGVAAAILDALDVTRVRLLTNNPRKVSAVGEAGVAVTERIPHQCGANPHNESYLFTKASKLGHLLQFERDTD